jgi:hypothetical protein
MKKNRSVLVSSLLKQFKHVAVAIALAIVTMGAIATQLRSEEGKVDCSCGGSNELVCCRIDFDKDGKADLVIKGKQ